MRVYLPTTLTDLAGILKSGELGPAPLRGYAVTPALRESYASGDEEELEYVAMLTAARESVRQLARDPEAPRRRVVLAADVPDSETVAVTMPDGDEEPSAVTVTSVIPLSKIASGQVDDEDAAADVAAAADASDAADAGDPDAEFTVDGAEGHELGWYATQELSYVTPGT